MKSNKILSVGFVAFLLLIGSSSYFTEARLKAGEFKHTILMERERRFSERWRDFTNLIERSISRNLLFNNEFIDLHGAFYKAIQKKIVEDPLYGQLYCDDEGFLFFPVNKAVDHQQINIENILKLRDKLNDSTDFLVIIIPDKSTADGADFPPGLNSYSKENLKEFYKELNKNHIEYIDFSENINKKEQYYKSDHHWKIETAFNAFIKIASDFYGDTLDTSWGKFSWHTMSNSFIGSFGRRVGRFYTAVDDFKYVLPEFQTDYQVDYLYSTGRKSTKAGSFEQAICDQNILLNKDLSTNRYAFYLGGDAAQITIINNNLKQEKTLIIKDSFGLPVGAFLSFINRETVLLDIRGFRKFGSITEFVSRNKFDKVLLFYNSEMLKDNGMFNFSNGKDY